MQRESRPSPECNGGYSTRQMAGMFSDVWDEWEEFAELGFGVTLSACTGKQCGGVAHGVSFPVADVLQFEGWLTHDWPRIKQRRAFHRAAVPYLHTDWAGSAAIIRQNLALMRTRPSAAVRGRYLDEWEAAVNAGPGEVERLATTPGEHGEELRQASPFAGVLPDQERQLIVKEERMGLSNEEQVEKWRDHPWFPIIERTHRDLEEHIPGYTVLQIKQKFGGLRYYFRFPDPMPEFRGWSEEQLRSRCKETVAHAEGWVDGYQHAQARHSS